MPNTKPRPAEEWELERAITIADNRGEKTVHFRDVHSENGTYLGLMIIDKYEKLGFNIHIEPNDITAWSFDWIQDEN